MIEIALHVARAAFALDLDLRLARAATGVFGPSGAGKSTLLHAIAGLVPARRLRLAVDGEVIADHAAGLRAPAHRRRVGLVFQDHRLFPHLSVLANLRYGMRAGAGGPGLDEVVGLLELAPLLERRPRQCSGGERQRVALGRALLSAPRLLLLDEPLASLDRGLKKQILPFLRRVRQVLKVPLIHVSHDLGELLAVSDELLLLDRGRALAQGALVDLAGRPETLPLLHDLGLVNVLPGTVEAHAPADGLSWLRLDGAAGVRLAAALCDLPPGAAIEALLRPEDVVLARGVPGALSLSNHLSGTVAAITATAQRTLVRVDIGAAAPLLCEIAARGVRELALEPGAPVGVLCTAVAVQVRPR